LNTAGIWHFGGIFVLLVTFFSLAIPAFSATNAQQQIQSSGEIVHQTAPNLAVIPDAWKWGYYGNVPLYVFTDYTVVRNGHPSLRIQKGGGVDPFGLVDRSIWTNEPFGFNVNVGDHVVARCWMRTDPSSMNNTVQGVRIGVDFWSNGHILGGYPDMFIKDNSPWVHWGTSAWTMREYDFVIPSTIFTVDQTGNPISPTQVKMIEMWAQVYPPNDNGNAWIADAELYINP
jgi:hypothetical protein